MIDKRILQLGAACAALSLAGCAQGADSKAEAANVTTAAAKPKKVPYCFFKDENSKGWSVSARKDGTVTVKGKAYVADGRYKAALKPPEVEGATASLYLAMPENDTGYSTRDGWWDVTAAIPGDSRLDSVKILCGAKTVASLEVRRKG